MTIVKIVAMILQLSVVLIGFPAQVSRNFQKNENGEVGLKLYLVFSCFSVRFVSTTADGVWYIFVPDMLAILIIGITISQIWRPRNRVAKAIHSLYRGAANLFTTTPK